MHGAPTSCPFRSNERSGTVSDNRPRPLRRQHTVIAAPRALDASSQHFYQSGCVATRAPGGHLGRSVLGAHPDVVYAVAPALVRRG
jgi:hypothetical protein